MSIKRKLKFTVTLELDLDEVPSFEKPDEDGGYLVEFHYLPTAFGDFVRFDSVELVDEDADTYRVVMDDDDADTYRVIMDDMGVPLDDPLREVEP